jgi:sugar phosphate isomerase/epimerase
MIRRRDFIRQVGLITAGTMACKAFPSFLIDKQMIGIQLWTVRDFITKETDSTLKKISEIGYNSIEPYGFDGTFYGISPSDFRKMVEDLGMKLTSTHTGISSGNAGMIIDGAYIAGLEMLVMPSPGGRPIDTPDDFKRLAEELNKIGEKVSDAGLLFGYHNHDKEFESTDGMVHYDILLKETDPNLVFFQLDLAWIVKGGYDPVTYFEKYPGRFKSWHVKDLGESGSSIDFGHGSVDLKAAFKNRDKAGLIHYFVEQEEYKTNAFKSIEHDYNYLHKNIL